MTVQSAGPRVLSSNSVAIPFDDRHFAPLPDSAGLLGDAAALRARLAADGALYLRGVLDPEVVRRLRGAYFELFPAGYLKPGTRPEEGILGDPSVLRTPYGLPGHPAHAFVRSDRFARFVDQPVLRELAEEVLGAPASRLPRVILRHFDRFSGKSSRVHIDHAYMDRGTERVVTMWLMVGDSHLAHGGLVYLAGSHRLTPEELAPLRAVTDRPDDRRALSHDLGWVASRLGRRWLWADYEAGDLTLHGPRVLHAALDNTVDQMRVSVDLRFAASADQPDERWLRPWSADDGA